MSTLPPDDFIDDLLGEFVDIEINQNNPAQSAAKYLRFLSKVQIFILAELRGRGLPTKSTKRGVKSNAV